MRSRCSYTQRTRVTSDNAFHRQHAHLHEPRAQLRDARDRSFGTRKSISALKPSHMTSVARQCTSRLERMMCSWRSGHDLGKIGPGFIVWHRTTIPYGVLTSIVLIFRADDYPAGLMSRSRSCRTTHHHYLHHFRVGLRRVGRACFVCARFLVSVRVSGFRSFAREFSTFQGFATCAGVSERPAPSLCTAHTNVAPNTCFAIDRLHKTDRTARLIAIALRCHHSTRKLATLQVVVSSASRRRLVVPTSVALQQQP